MEEKYQVELSVLLESLEYCSDVESDGYYIVRGSNKIIAYGEDLSEEYLGEDAVWKFLQSNECIKLPTLNEIEDASPNWNRDITFKYIDEMTRNKRNSLLKHINPYSVIVFFMHFREALNSAQNLPSLGVWMNGICL